MSDPMNIDEHISSNSSNSRNSNENVVLKPWNILTEHPGMKIDEKFVLKLTKGTENVSKEVKIFCKVLHFSSEWNFEELLAVLDGLNHKEYPNMFVVVIEGKNFEFLRENLEKCDKIKKLILKLSHGRPLVLQLTSEDENTEKFYYKEETLDNFIDIDQTTESFDKIKDFPTLLSSFLDGKIEIVDQITAAWRPIIKSSVAFKFLKLFENLFFKLILEVAKSGTKADLLTILDAPVEHEGRVLSIEAQQYLSEVLYEEQSNNEPAEHIADTEESNSNDFSIEFDHKNGSVDESSSVLLTAIENKNTEVIDYLITYWTHLIQQLPFGHQVKISTVAFETEQLDVLCDLLEIADFPFPEDFEFGDEKGHERLRKIILQRMAFTNGIKRENFDKIDQFIDSNLNLKYAYSIDNETALTQAIDLKKFGVFYYLNSLGFQGEDCLEILNGLNKDERKKATQQAEKQRNTNVKLALVNVDKSVLLLATRSLIHNRKISTEQEAEYRLKIINWLQDIHKIAPEMLDVAASCDNLKIIFDFESKTVDNIDLETSNSWGLTRRISKWIFIGSKLSDKKREQQIKGVLAHELCHYVMCLVYNNKFLPYYEDALDIRDKLEKVVNLIDKWSADDSEYPDDECNRNISSVFTCYDPEKFHLELIVRAVQIQVEFDDNQDKSKYLIEKYEKLFDFWKEHVMPDLQNYLKRNKYVIKLNKYVEVLPNILQKDIKIKNKKDVETLVQSTLSVAITNSSTLLFIDIIENLREKCGNLLDSQNFFTKPHKLNNDEIWNDFEEMCKDVENLNIFVDCTKEVPPYLGTIFVNMELSFTFIVSSESLCQELMNILNKKKMKDAKKVEINYNWSDLSEESQKLLLKTKINFQNNSQITLLDLIKAKEPPGPTDALPNLSEIVDNQLLNLMIESKKLSINSTKELDSNEKYFEILNQPRKFLRNEKNNNNQSDSEQDSNEIPEISQHELISEAKNKKIVLISDIAGNGKSWAMKNFAKILRKQNPTRWVTYVDLKQFIKEFKAQKDEPEFSTFIVEKILKPEQKFEAKIFQRLYKDGKVFILFDGFDEIAPDCAEFVSKLAQSFQLNEGNQLWIATRDYFEVDLREKLQLDISYGLNEMYDEDGIEMIAKSWMLMDLRNNKEVMSVEEFNQFIDDSSDFKEYKLKAEQIVEKVDISWNRSVGMPQMFKIIADGFKDEEDVNNLTSSKIYLQFILNLYKRWSDEKGKIRKDASIECQQFELNFWRFHQFHAIKSLFPELIKILFPGYNGSKLSVEEVIACGLMSIKNGEFYFLHETFREYFVADALAKALKNEEINEKVVEVFVEILTIEKFEIIRMFLNDSIDSTTLKNIKPQKRIFLKKLYQMENFEDFFTENHENIADFVISILKEGDYEKTKEILKNKSGEIARCTKNSKMFLKFQDFLCEFLKTDDLKNLITSEWIFIRIIQYGLKIEVFADFVLKIESKTGRDFIQEELRNAISKGWMQEFKFGFFFDVPDPKALKFREFLKMLQKYFSVTEVLEFLKKKGDLGENILFACVKKEDKEILTEVENYFTNQNLKKDFKELLKQQREDECNILHEIARCDNFDSHKEFWELLLKTIEDRDELKDFVLQKNKWGDNFVYELVRWNKNHETIEWKFKLLKENFNDSQFREIIQSRGPFNRNLLHSTALGGHNIDTFKLLWEFFHSSFKSEQEFWEIVKESDESGLNILNYAIWKTQIEILNFVMDKIEKNLTNEEIKKMLRNCGKPNIAFSLLHSAARNDNSEVFKTVWKFFQNYFNPAEILKIAKQVDGRNAVNFMFSFENSEILEFAIEELGKIVSRDEIRIMLSIKNKSNQNILQNYALNWRKSLEFHEILWKTIRRFFNDLEILLFIKHVDIDRHNVLHNAVSKSNGKEIVEFLWNEIKSFMNRNEQIEYLKMKSKYGKNLIEMVKKKFNLTKPCIEDVLRNFEEYGINLEYNPKNCLNFEMLKCCPNSLAIIGL